MEVKERIAGCAVRRDRDFRREPGEQSENAREGADQRVPPARVQQGLAAEEQPEHVEERRHQEERDREMEHERVQLAGHPATLP